MYDPEAQEELAGAISSTLRNGGVSIFDSIGLEAVDYAMFERDDTMKKDGQPRKYPVYDIKEVCSSTGGEVAFDALKDKGGNVRLTVIKTEDIPNYSHSPTAPDLNLQCRYAPGKCTFNVSGLRRDLTAAEDSWYSGEPLPSPNLSNGTENPWFHIRDAALIVRISANERQMEVFVLRGKRAEATAYRRGFAMGYYDPYIERLREVAVEW